MVVVNSFIIHKSHREEVHKVADDASVIIYDASGNFLKRIYPRPSQIKKLYASFGMRPTREILRKAYCNSTMGLNI